MSKAILVLEEMPDNCKKCPLCKKDELIALGYYAYEQLYICQFMPEEVLHDEEDCSAGDYYINKYMVESTKPDWCPLQQMPEKSHTGKSEYYQWGDWEDGWNACIDGLLPE